MSYNNSQYSSTITYNTGITSTTFPTQEDHLKLCKRLEAIEERLAIIIPNQTLHDKFPALQEAYEAYKIVERLVNEKT